MDKYFSEYREPFERLVSLLSFAVEVSAYTVCYLFLFFKSYDCSRLTSVLKIASEEDCITAIEKGAMYRGMIAFEPIEVILNIIKYLSFLN